MAKASDVGRWPVALSPQFGKLSEPLASGVFVSSLQGPAQGAKRWHKIHI